MCWDERNWRGVALSGEFQAKSETQVGLQSANPDRVNVVSPLFVLSLSGLLQ
jgi:hypothetical protein